MVGFYRRPPALTEDLVLAGHQQALDALLAELGRQMGVTWGLLDLDNLDATRAAWLRQAVAVVEDHQASAAQVAAAFCQDLATVATGQGMDVLLPDLRADEVARETARALDALGPAGVKERIGRGIAPQTAWAQAREAVTAAAARRVMDADRQTVMASARADPRATGWRRVTHGGCKFCRMLAGRGEVYTADSVRFASHDHCRCTAAPAWGGPEVGVHQYTASKRRVTPAERERLRDYLAGMEDDGITPKRAAGGAPPRPPGPPAPPAPPHEDPREPFPDRDGHTHRVHVRAKPPGRRETHFTVRELEERGLLAPAEDPHHYLDADVRKDGTLRPSDTTYEHDLAAALAERYGLHLVSVQPTDEPGRKTPDTVTTDKSRTIELKRSGTGTVTSVKNLVKDGSKQSPTVVVDARHTTMSAPEAEEALHGAMRWSGDRLDEVVVLLPDDQELHWRRDE